MTFFSHQPYMTLFLTKNLYFTKNSFISPFISHFVLFLRIPSPYMGGVYIGRPPTSNLGGPSPSHPKSPPMGLRKRWIQKQV